MGGVFDFYPGHASLCHCLKCSMQRWACKPTLWGSRQCTADSTSASNGISSFTLARSTCVARGRPGGYDYSL